MKKLLCLLLATLMLLSLCACGEKEPTQKAEEKGLRIGYGRASITPSYSVPLAGYGNTFQRMSEGFLNKLYATCIAITDEQDNTILLITTDVIAVANGYVEPVRQSITAATGVPADKIMFQGTHTHSGPDIYTTQGVMAQYKTDYINALTEAATQAMQDRSLATMKMGEAYTENLNFVRHYTVSDGTIYGDNFGSLNGGQITGHLSDADNQIQLLLVERKDKKDILMVNWQAHAKLASTAETDQGMFSRSLLASDYIGSARDYVEQQADVHFAFFLGAAGNLNTFSKIPSENRSAECNEFGKLLGDHILSGLENMTAVGGTTVNSTQRMYTAPVDHSDDELSAAAQKVKSAFEAGAGFQGSLDAGKEDRIVSPYHAISILIRAGLPESQTMEINALSVGDIGFVTAPYEMFDTNGMYIKENSPFAMTFVMTCANGHYDYIASAQAYENGGTYEVHCRRFPKGTAENLADSYLEMLTQIHE